MKTRQHFFDVQQIKESLPTVTPSKLSDDSWGVWLDVEAQATASNLPHPFCEVESKSGKTWIVEVNLDDVDTEFHSGSKYPSKSIQEDEISLWLDSHRKAYEEDIPKLLRSGQLNHSDMDRKREDLHAYFAAKNDYENEGQDMDDTPFDSTEYTTDQYRL